MPIEEPTKPNEARPLTVNVTLDPDAAKGLLKLCEYEGRSKVGVFRWLLRKEMRSHEVFQGSGRN